jgi:hypothetical protein
MLKKLGKIFNLQPSDITDSTVHGWGLVILWIYFLLWIAGVVFLYSCWDDLNPWIKYPLAAVEALVVPDMNIFRDLFGLKK